MRDGPATLTFGGQNAWPQFLLSSIAAPPMRASTGKHTCHQHTGRSDCAKSSRAARPRSMPANPPTRLKTRGSLSTIAAAVSLASVANTMFTSGEQPGSPGSSPTSSASFEMRSTTYWAELGSRLWTPTHTVRYQRAKPRPDGFLTTSPMKSLMWMRRSDLMSSSRRPRTTTSSTGCEASLSAGAGGGGDDSCAAADAHSNTVSTAAKPSLVQRVRRASIRLVLRQTSTGVYRKAARPRRRRAGAKLTFSESNQLLHRWRHDTGEARARQAAHAHVHQLDVVADRIVAVESVVL